MSAKAPTPVPADVQKPDPPPPPPRRSSVARPLVHLRAPLASRVGCPAQTYVSELHRTCGGHVHAGWFCLFVHGARAYPVEELQDVAYHECEGCSGDHVEGGGP